MIDRVWPSGTNHSTVIRTPWSGRLRWHGESADEANGTLIAEPSRACEQFACRRSARTHERGFAPSSGLSAGFPSLADGAARSTVSGWLETPRNVGSGAGCRTDCARPVVVRPTALEARGQFSGLASSGDAEPGHAALEGRRFEAQAFGGAAGAADAPVRAFEHACECARPRAPRASSPPRGVVRPDGLGSRHDEMGARC